MEHHPLSQAQLKARRKAELEANIRYVEALDGEGDYWLSVTDASRVCRIQDVSLRRAINRGDLPVRRERAGQNKRTRFVRASDLPRAGYPIVDESAAITTEIGKADILSIPRQQQQISHDHKQLMSHYAEILTALEQFTTTFRQQGEQIQRDLQALRDELTASLAASEERSAAAVQALREAFTQNQQETTETLQDLREGQEELHQQGTRHQTELQALSTSVENRLQEQQGQLGQLRDDVQQQQVSHQAQVQTLSTRIEHNREEVRQSLQTYQQGVEEALDKASQDTQALIATLQQQVITETGKIGQQLTATTERLETSLQSQQATLTSLSTQLETQRQYTRELETTLSRQAERIAKVEALEHTVAEQQQAISRQEPLLSLTPQVEYLYRILTERGILPGEQGKDKRSADRRAQ